MISASPSFRLGRVLSAGILALSILTMNTPLLAFAQTDPGNSDAQQENSTEKASITVDSPTTAPAAQDSLVAIPEVPPTPSASCTIVSDTTTQESGHDSAILTFLHSSWTTISGASWIWGENPVSDTTVDKTEVFTKKFTLSAVPSSASVTMAADNSYVLTVNGTVIADQSAVSDNFSATQTYNIASALAVGINTIEVTVTNSGVLGSDPTSNPAGLIYKVTINGSECGTVPPPPAPVPTITIVATNVTCANEADLPNWGAGGHTIGSSTAKDFIKASNKACHGQSGWNFEWADQSGGDSAGNFTGPLGGAYASFGPTNGPGIATTTVPLTSGTTEFHLRQVLKPGYLGFTKDSNNNYGAEFYCSTDALNYDNWDFIRNPVAGTTYYCASFNAPAVSTVKICKVSDAPGNPGLSGWNVMLTGSHIEDIAVDSASLGGSDTTNTFAGPTISYLAKVTGTWLNQGGANPTDAEYSTTDNWTTHMDGYTGYSNDILELGINNKYGNWGPYNSGHTYAQSFTQPVSKKAHLGIFDGTVDGLGNHTQNPAWFGDNNGSLNVSLFHGHAGITGADGCATFTGVRYGTYTVGETPQDGWNLVSGGDSVTVDGPTETYTLVNHQAVIVPEPDPEPTTINNTVVVKSADIAASALELGANPSKWFFYDDVLDVVNSALGSFVTGPQTPVLGTGSAQMSVIVNERTNLVTAGYGGTLLSAIKHLSFDTYNPSAGNGDAASANHSAYLEFNISFDGSNTYQSRLNYVPSTNAAGTITQDAWKTWDAINGGNALWTYKNGATNWPVTLVGPDAGLTNSAPRSWNAILADYPNAKMLGGGGSFFGVRVGEPYANGYTEDVDNIVVGVQGGSVITKTSYDFEPTQVVITPEVTPTTPTPSQGTSSGGGSRSGGSSRIAAPTGQVLGAATSTDELPAGCGPLISTYMKVGSKSNDSAEVSKLQSFLNSLMGTMLPVTGMYGPLTKNAVTKFQEKYYADVLTPWAQVGKGKEHIGTGYVYKTTQRKINLLYCDTLVIPLPDVVNEK